MRVSDYLEELAADTRTVGVVATARRIGVYPRTVEAFCVAPAEAPPLVVSRIATLITQGSDRERQLS